MTCRPRSALLHDLQARMSAHFVLSREGDESLTVVKKGICDSVSLVDR